MLAPTIHAQFGAQMMRSGTGSPASHPAMRSGLRPTRSDSRPAIRFVTAFASPKPTRKDSATVFDARPNSARAMRGRIVRSSPTIAPTNALTTTSSANWRQLAPRPSRRGGGGVVSGNGAAIGARLQLRGITVGQDAGFVERDDPVMVRRGGRGALKNRLHEL